MQPVSKTLTHFVILGQPSSEPDCACAALNQCQTNSHCYPRTVTNEKAVTLLQKHVKG